MDYVFQEAEEPEQGLGGSANGAGAMGARDAEWSGQASCCARRSGR